MKLIQLIAVTFSLIPVAISYGQDEGMDVDDLFADDFEAEEEITINDPLEGINRAIFKFNDGVYTKVLKPFARTYANVMPDPVEQGVSNVFENLKFPSRFVSNVLQGRFGQAGKETGKFVVNTTVGVLGIMKPSDRIESLDTSDEDIGQAFGRWGIGHGFYLVIPFIGPSSFRDFVGDLADDIPEPLPKPWTIIEDSTDRMILRAIEITNNLPGLLEIYDSMKRSAIDPYASVRDAYAQRRARMVEE